MRDFRDYVMMAGGIALIAGAVLRITGIAVAPYLYLGGAIIFGIAQIMDRYDGDSPVVKRLRAQQVLGALFLLISGFLMYAERWRPDIIMNHQSGGAIHSTLVALTAPNNWILFMCIAAVFELYSSFRLDKELEKEKERS